MDSATLAQADADNNAQPMPKFSRSAQQFRDPDGVMHTITQDDQMARLIEDGEAMAAVLVELRRRMPSEEEMFFLRNEKQTKERYAWAWAVIRQYFGWAVVAVGIFGSGVYWLAKAVMWLAENIQWRPH